MQLRGREIWALVHGMVIGGPFLLAFPVHSCPWWGSAATT